MSSPPRSRVGYVEVDGGRLAYQRCGPAGGVAVLAAHGLTAHRGVWAQCASALPDVDFVAVDLRGRGASRELPGPSSVERHARDLEQLADALGLDRVVVAGHSMGAFVALVCAARRPATMAGVVLVDGGLPFPDGGPDVAPTVARLRRGYASAEEYRAFWRSHPALGPYWSPAVERYVDGDLVGAAPDLRAGCVPERAAEDALDLLGPSAPPSPLERLRCPTVLLRAARGLADEPVGAYPPGYAEGVVARHPCLELHNIDNVNHFTILLDRRGAGHVAEAIRAAVTRAEDHELLEEASR